MANMKRIEARPTRRIRAKNGDTPKPSVEERLLAAMERLLEKGHRFASLSVEQLTEEAGISRGTFYLHFSDKGDLIARLMSQFTDELVNSTGAWFTDAEEAQPADVQKALVGMVATFKKHQAVLGAVNDMAPFDEKVGELYKKMVETICERSRKTLRTVKKKGRSRPGLTDDVVDIVSWMIVLYCARFVGEREGAELNRLGRSLGYIAASASFADTSL